MGREKTLVVVRCRANAVFLSPYEMAVPEFMPEIPIPDSYGVSLLNPANTCEASEHGEMACDRVVKPCEQPVYSVHSVSWMNVEARCSSAGAKPGRCPGSLEGSHYCCSDCDDTASTAMNSIDSVSGCLGNPERLRVNDLSLHLLILYF